MVDYECPRFIRKSFPTLYKFKNILGHFFNTSAKASSNSLVKHTKSLYSLDQKPFT